MRPVTQPMPMDHLNPIENAFKYVCSTDVNEDKMILALILEFIMLEIVIGPELDQSLAMLVSNL